MRRMYSKPQLLEAVEQEAEVNGLKAFENIVDKDGHKRFVEGDISLSSDMPEGYTKVYGKWSLSGSHLLLVLCISGLNTTAITSFTTVGKAENLPQWILDKIYPIQSVFVEQKSVSYFGSDLSTQTATTYLRKDSSGLYIQTTAFTLTADRVCRIAFDLLIDNE